MSLRMMNSCPWLTVKLVLVAIKNKYPCVMKYCINLLCLPDCYRRNKHHALDFCISSERHVQPQENVYGSMDYDCDQLNIYWSAKVIRQSMSMMTWNGRNILTLYTPKQLGGYTPLLCCLKLASNRRIWFGCT